MTTPLPESPVLAGTSLPGAARQFLGSLGPGLISGAADDVMRTGHPMLNKERT